VGGGALLLVGFALFSTSVFYFWSRGRGTLAPWDPPRRFVIEGPYRYVRNPMISGVIFLLFTLINLAYIPLLEEPMLAVRFGEPYKRYTRAVSRFVPRFSPWSLDSTS
jgi:protein-S-isoprenylcysteine O-methyltransferase Ste14